MTTCQPVVAIDGPAGSGKSTVAQQAAQLAGLQFISSGAMYRAVALCALRAGTLATDRDRLEQIAATLPIRFTTAADGTVRTIVAEEDVTDALRDPAVAQVAAIIAALPAVRAHLVAKQQAYGRDGGIVMEGRDIQTVVFPNADIKLFVTASPEERALRRWKELQAQETPADYRTVLAEVIERDARDESREASPLRAAPDAITIVTDGQTVEQVVHYLLRIIDTWRADPSLHGQALARVAGCPAAGAPRHAEPGDGGIR